MQITSSAFQNNAVIPTKYTCDGERVSPALAFSDIPAEAKSLALIMDDPDAPSGEFVHWVVFNLPPDTDSLAEGQKNYIPPCPPRVDERQRVEAGPPSGRHHYIFKIYALDTMLELDANATKRDVLAAVKNHILAQGELFGLYGRQ